MDPAKNRLNFIKDQLDKAFHLAKLSPKTPPLVAVSKRQSEAKIRQMLDLGVTHFAENQLQEAQAHWEPLRADCPKVKLHLIGPLQSNKVRDAVALFDVIHTVDREKIARSIKDECEKQHRHVPCLIQVNIGEEPQKHGISPVELPDFLGFCREEIGLPICGLMAIPPEGVNPAPYFALMKKLADRHELRELSMGMSSDYQTAIRFGATYIRVGTALFGEREH